MSALSINQFLAYKFPARNFILAPWLESQSLSLVYAARGTGKTFFCLSLAYAVASGARFLNWQALRPRRVLFFDAEMPGSVTQERVANIVNGVSLEPPEPGFFRIINPDHQDFPIPDLAKAKGWQRLEEHLHGVDLLILDNLSALCRSGEENAAESWVDIQGRLLALRRQGVSVLLVHHAGKSGQQRGTSKREDILDAVLRLSRPEDYSPADGCRFEIRFEKARQLAGAELNPIEAQLNVEGGVAQWEWKRIEDDINTQVRELAAQGVAQRQIGKDLGISQTRVWKILHKNRGENLGQNSRSTVESWLSDSAITP